jgi:cytochrome c oxidase accessory protein FixG
VDPAAAKIGHCIDCTLCVQVCPTGIDIRNGQQYQCIACAACVDVCDSVMDKMNYPRGLIRYTTLNALEGKPTRLLRPRVVIYGSLLGLVALALVISVLLRVPLALDILRDRASLFRETNEGQIENVYTLKLMNMDRVAHEYRLSAGGLKDIQLLADSETVHIDAGQVREVPVRLRVDPSWLRARSTEIEIHVQALDAERQRVTETTRFLGPAVGRR